MLALILASVFSPAPCVCDKGDISCRLAPTKPNYLEGEPIEIAITVVNRSTAKVAVEVDYPYFDAASDTRISFDAEKAGLRGRPKRKLDWLDYTVGIDWIGPGEQLEITLYLQRFIESPKTGRYRLPYALIVTYWPGAPTAENQPAPILQTIRPENTRKLNLQGELVFEIRPGTRAELEGVVKVYEERILRSYDARLGSSDDRWWLRQGATEALCLVEDPLVISYLGVLPPEKRLPALARFRDNRDAQLEVLGCLASKRDSEVLEALNVLADWKYEVRVEDVCDLLKRDSERIHDATVKYIKAIDKKEYLDLLDPSKQQEQRSRSEQGQKPPAGSNDIHNYALLALILFALAVPTLGFFLSRWREKAKANGEAPPG